MINRFREQYSFLSNFYPSPIRYQGIEYPTVEHAYQAAKTLNVFERSRISKLDKPAKAKKAGAMIHPADFRKDWELVKVDVMRELLRLKFQNRELRLQLQLTYDEELQEVNWWGDKFWGIYRGEGQNWLGRLLMEERDRRNE